jgi:hypothetical protein
VSREAALVRARGLRDHLQDFGVPVSIELQTGRSGGWNGLYPYANLGHHVASRASQGDTPFLWLVKEGRSDVPGPLCNGYLGFDGVARLITMDWANHPGEGGPWTVPGVTIPQNNGRPYIFGWECEGGYELSDWPRDHRWTMARCFAATLRWMGRDERSHGEHGNPWAKDRKVDRLYYYQHLGEARAEIAALLSNSSQPLPQEDPDMLKISSDDRGDGQGVAVREALNDWLRAWNRVKVALGEPTSTWEFLPLSDTIDGAVVARVEYVCRNARTRSVPDDGLDGVSFAHLDLVAMDYARMVELANRIHDDSHHEMMATMQEQITRLLAADASNPIG